MDLVPGLVTRYWFTPTTAGTFDLNCQELCASGTSRSRPDRGRDDAAPGLVSSYPTFAQVSAHPVGDAAAGAGLFAVCSACHGQHGEGNPRCMRRS